MAEISIEEVREAMERANDAMQEKLNVGADFVMPARSVEAVVGGISVIIASDMLPGVKDMLIMAREELFSLHQSEDIQALLKSIEEANNGRR